MQFNLICRTCETFIDGLSFVCQLPFSVIKLVLDCLFDGVTLLYWYWLTPSFSRRAFFLAAETLFLYAVVLFHSIEMSLSARQNKYSLKSCCALREKSDNFLPNFVLCMFCKLYPTSVCFLRMHEDCISQRILDSTLSSQFWYVYAYQCMLTR